MGGEREREFCVCWMCFHLHACAMRLVTPTKGGLAPCLECSFKLVCCLNPLEHCVLAVAGCHHCRIELWTPRCMACCTVWHGSKQELACVQRLLHAVADLQRPACRHERSD